MSRRIISDEIAVAASQKIKERDYWLEKLSGELVRTTFPYDFIYNEESEAVFKSEKFKIRGQLLLRLMKLINASDSRLFVTLVSVLVTLLEKYTGSRDIFLGAPIYRQAADVEFLNTVLTLRAGIEENTTFKELLIQVRQTVTEALENYSYPIEKLYSQLDIQSTGDDSLLFDIAVLLKNIQEKEYLRHVNPNMIFSFHRTGESLEGEVEYNISLYETKTIKRIVSHFTRLLENILENIDSETVGIQVLSGEEKKHLTYQFNRTETSYPSDKPLPCIFEEQVEKKPDIIAVVFKEEFVTYRWLNRWANKLANYLILEKSVLLNGREGILMDRSIGLIAVIFGVLKAGGTYVPIDSSFPEERIRKMIDDSQIEVLVSNRRYIRLLNRLQWDCSSLHSFICVDSQDIYGEEEIEKNELMGRKLWEYTGETSSDEITGGGWQSSYTGEPIPKVEMDEYGDNILKKLLPLLHKNMRVLEIGCASGITMFRIAPRVGFYYGTDLSRVIIDKNSRRIEEEGIQNITLACLPAHEIDSIEDTDFDLVIINSVIQCFHGHNYLRKILKKLVIKIKEKGWIFIGDIMNRDLREPLVQDLKEFKKNNSGKNYKTKTDWSAELFVSPLFFEDMVAEIPGIKNVEFSDKIHTIENELTRFRYDALFTVNKKEKKQALKKHKYQQDLKALETYSQYNPGRSARPDNYACIIYTSGSTGKSRGILTRHYNAVRVVKDTNYVILKIKSPRIVEVKIPHI